MKKFITHLIVYIFIFLLILFSWLNITSTIVKNRNFENYETESNTLIIGSEKKYDLIFMGISHARNFSRHKNHLRIEKILNKKIINLGQGGNICGVNEQFFYLTYFYSSDNCSETLIYILSPSLLFSETLPIASNTFNKEIFDINFFIDYLFFNSENKFQRLREYIVTKLQSKWLNYYPHSLDEKKDSLVKIDSLKIKRGLNYAYKGGLNMKRFEKSCDVVKKTIELSIKNNTKVILLIPPAVFGKWNGHNETEIFGKEMVKAYPDSVKFYDFSESVLTPSYYYDHHHLNTKGVVYFTEHYLKNILSN